MKLAIFRELSRWLRGRDAVLWLECEAFHATAWNILPDLLTKAFPDARFILTVRDCYSWLDSVINQHLNIKVSPPFQQLRNLYHADPVQREVAALEVKGLYSLQGYLSYWARHNDFVLNAVPSDKLLVDVPTRGLSEHTDDIASFVGVDHSSAQPRAVALAQVSEKA